MMKQVSHDMPAGPACRSEVSTGDSQAPLRAESPRSGITRPIVAVILAVVVNALLVLVLANFNGLHTAVNRDAPHPAFVVMHDSMDNRSRIDQPDAQEQDVPPEVMTVDLDLPAPGSATIRPMDINLWVPENRTDRSARNPFSRPNKASSANAGGSSTVYSSARVDEPPRELLNEAPRYPRDALKRSIEGAVTVKLMIDSSGRVHDVKVVRVEGDPSFRDAVLEVAKNWRFAPARHHGKPVAVWGIKRVRFELEK